jgi:hypothetical protein
VEQGTSFTTNNASTHKEYVHGQIWFCREVQYLQFHPR